MDASNRHAYCFKLVDGAFQQVLDPTDNLDGGGDVNENIRLAGYVVQIDSRSHDHIGAEIVVYSTIDEKKPRFYIDVCGKHGGLGSFVAEDFPSLVQTLKEVSALIAMIGLDQQVDIQAESMLTKHPGL